MPGDEIRGKTYSIFNVWSAHGQRKLIKRVIIFMQIGGGSVSRPSIHAANIVCQRVINVIALLQAAIGVAK